MSVISDKVMARNLPINAGNPSTPMIGGQHWTASVDSAGSGDVNSFLLATCLSNTIALAQSTKSQVLFIP